MNWYIKHNSNGQSLMIDEITGKTIAVFYDQDDADKMQIILEHYYATKNTAEDYGRILDKHEAFINGG